MIITNHYNLPQSFVQLAQRERQHRPGRYSVTELLKGVREAILLRRHSDEITVDVADMVWMLFGQAAHYMLERQPEADSELAEERLEVPVVDPEFGRELGTLTGAFDLYDAATHTVTDYKTTSVWKIIYSDFDDWRQQLLCYAWLLRRTGFEVTSGRVVAFLRDHSKREAERKPDYPNLPVYQATWHFSNDELQEIDGWITGRVCDLSANERFQEDNTLPLCTPEERWNSGDTYAVMVPGRKRAQRVLDSEQAAVEWAQDNVKGGSYEIIRRPGEDTKCRFYCLAQEFCSYYALHVKELGASADA